MFDFEIFRLVFASLVGTLFVVFVIYGILERWCVLDLPPIVNLLLLTASLILLAYVEGLHYACVSIAKLDMSSYKADYPHAYSCAALLNNPTKVKQFLVGRQFVVILLVFLIAQITSFPDIANNFLDLPYFLIYILKSGLPGIIMVLTFGQLVSQIFVEEFTIPFLNLHGCYSIIMFSLAIERIGVCHFSWLLFHAAVKFITTFTDAIPAPPDHSAPSFDSKVSYQATTELRNPDMLNSPLLASPSKDEGDFFWLDVVRYVWSTAVTLGAIGVIGWGVSEEAYVLDVPEPVAVVALLCCLVVLFYLEGLMIAIVSTQYMPRATFTAISPAVQASTLQYDMRHTVDTASGSNIEALGDPSAVRLLPPSSIAYPRALGIRNLMRAPHAVKRFIIGRQCFTVTVAFLLAQITTFSKLRTDAIPDALFYVLCKSGLVGVLITLSFGQLLPELLAQEFPVQFMNAFGSYSVSAFALVLEQLGVGHFAWAIYYMLRNCICGGAYVSTASVRERAMSIPSSP